MTTLYRTAQWMEFRREVIERQGRRCQRCDRSSDEGTVLAVHHPYYVSGRKPWEYPLSDCDTLCQGCHAAEHGIVPPQVGWEYVIGSRRSHRAV